MAAEPISAVSPIAALSPQLRQRERRTRLTGLALMAPAVLLVALFLFLPLVFILQMSFTEGQLVPVADRRDLHAPELRR